MILRFTLCATFLTCILTTYGFAQSFQKLDEASMRASLVEDEILTPLSMNSMTIPDENGTRTTVPLDLNDERDGIPQEKNIKEA
tara:strand:- start:661 stop:912 length:252 start_codon:yes stop_codon:yes gene_type:complete